MTKEQMQALLKAKLLERKFLNMTSEQYVLEAIDVLFDVASEVLAKKPVLTLPKVKK